MNHPGTAPLAVSATATNESALELRLPRYAPPKQRFAGFVCDVLILVVGWILAEESLFALLPDLVAWLATAIFGLAYVIGFTAAGVTPGSWVAGVRIIERFGRAPGLLRSLKRSFIPPLIWAATVAYLTSDPSPVQKVDYFLETHPDLIDGLWLVMLIMSFGIAVVEVILSADSRSRYPWRDDISGTFVVQVPAWFWTAVGTRIQESKDWLRRSRPLTAFERRDTRRRAEREKRAIAEREVRKAARQATYAWLNELPESSQDWILAWLTPQDKERWQTILAWFDAMPESDRNEMAAWLTVWRKERRSQGDELGFPTSGVERTCRNEEDSSLHSE